LSGSGSSIVAVVDDGSADAVAGAAVRAWQSMGVAAETFTTAAESTGATVDIA
jgi:homoserine kinase